MPAKDSAHDRAQRLSRHLTRLASGGYALAALLFAAGIYFDWQAAGLVIVPPLAFADDPYSNSGLFVLAVVLGVVSYAVSAGASRYASRHEETVDRTQEWTVDLDSDY